MMRTEERKIYIAMVDDGCMGFLPCRVQTGSPDGLATYLPDLKANHSRCKGEANAFT
jgi:hypothetical protein